MKLFVGTLYSGENEFQECLDSIKMQSYKDFQHFIFRDLPNKEAHITLFKSFLESGSDYDILIKVDADMVLSNDTLFEEIVRKFETNDWMDLFAIAVYDFFSDQLIWGLNSYRNTVEWDLEKEMIFVDISKVSSDRAYYDDVILAPAAIHCKNPSPFQAFHYGVHRGLKSIQPRGGSAHWSSLERTWNCFQRSRNVRIGLASLGTELVYAGKFGIEDLDYTNPRLKDALEEFVEWDAVRLYREINKLRLLNWGFLPGTIRKKAVRFFVRKRYKGIQT